MTYAVAATGIREKSVHTRRWACPFVGAVEFRVRSSQVNAVHVLERFVMTMVRGFAETYSVVAAPAHYKQSLI